MQTTVKPAIVICNRNDQKNSYAEIHLYNKASKLKTKYPYIVSINIADVLVEYFYM